MVLITIVFMGFINQLTSLGGPTLFSNRQAQELGRDASQYLARDIVSFIFSWRDPGRFPRNLNNFVHQEVVPGDSLHIPCVFLGEHEDLGGRHIFLKGLEMHQLKDFMG